MNKNKFLSLILIIAFIVFTNLGGGCSKKPEKKSLPKNQEKQESTEKPKEPKELTAVIKDIEKIIKSTEKKQEIKTNPDQMSPQNKGQQTGSGTQSKTSGNQQQNQENPLENWSGEEKTVEDIHKKWNSLEMAAVKAGAKDSLINEFETNLDNLTDKVMAKDILGTLNGANELYGSASKMAGLFKTSNPPEADMMKYYTQKTLLAVEEGDWSSSKENAETLQTQWDKVKPMISEKGARLMTQMDYAIKDFDQSISKQNKDVAKIKGEIVLSNIDKITKELKKASKK